MDRDRFAGDEALGFHVLPMSTLQIQVGTYQHIEAKLTCSQRGVSIDGMLSFSVGTSSSPVTATQRLTSSISQLFSLSPSHHHTRRKSPSSTITPSRLSEVRNDNDQATPLVRMDKKTEFLSLMLRGCEKWSVSLSLSPQTHTNRYHSSTVVSQQVQSNPQE